MYFIKEKECQHPADKRIIAVITAIVTCETTRIKCTVCNEYLSPPKTEC
jgi:hypothetical protein